LFLFRLTADQMAASRGWYDPVIYYDNDPATRAALVLIFSDHFRNEPGVFEPLRETLLTDGDTYTHLAAPKSYQRARAARRFARRSDAGHARLY
jgi:starch phosphorylase